MDIKTILTSNVKQSVISVTFQAKVVSCYTSTTKIKQSGRLSDATGNIRFVVWADSKLPLVTEGNSYLFKNAKGKLYNGKREIHLTKYSEIIAPPKIEQKIKPKEVTTPSEIIAPKKIEKQIIRREVIKLSSTNKKSLPSVLQKTLYGVSIILLLVGIFMLINYLRIESSGRMWPKIDEYFSNHVTETIFTVLRLVAIWFLIGGLIRIPLRSSK